MIKRYKLNEIDKLAQILKNDGVISIPTDTIFGICARIDSKKAHQKLIEVKNRSINKSFPVMCADEKQIKEIAIVNERAEKLIKAFMPGPITLILKKNSNLPEYVTNGKDTMSFGTIPLTKEQDECVGYIIVKKNNENFEFDYSHICDMVDY